MLIGRGDDTIMLFESAKDWRRDCKDQTTIASNHLKTHLQCTRRCHSRSPGTLPDRWRSECPAIDPSCCWDKRSGSKGVSAQSFGEKSWGSEVSTQLTCSFFSIGLFSPLSKKITTYRDVLRLKLIRARGVCIGGCG